MDSAQPSTQAGYYPDPDLFPLEHETVSLVEHCLRSQNWPFARMPVRVGFGLKPGSASRSKVDAAGKNGHGFPVGRVEVWYNLSYLHQNPKLFLSDIVAHECAHVLATAESLRAGRRISAHGEEWKRWLSKLSAVAMPKGYGWRGAFDDRVCLLAAGGVAYFCGGCEGDDRYHILSVKSGQPSTPCERCRQALAPCPREGLPLALIRETDVLVVRQMDKDLYGWVG